MSDAPIRKVVVIGDGGWGTAIALLLDKFQRTASIWSYDPAYAAVMRESRTNPRYLPGFPLPDSITIGSDFGAMAADADLLISAVPTAYLRDVWSAHREHLPPDLPIASVSKGLEQGTLLRPTQILAELLGESHHVAVLSGPNIAREIAGGLPAASVVASPDNGLARRIQEALSTDAFRIYRNPDPVGVELGGVLKNVIALAAGICDGLELGVNAKAALVARGLLEMARLGLALGGKRETFFGLAGLGDLMTTCYSPSSRNRTFGERVGRGERVEDIIASMQQVAEGAKSVGPLQMLMTQHGLAGPITEEMNLVINEDKRPQDVVTSLMRRAFRDEAEDLAI
jgi:glycerol-3-phosphate dehydrogenase (NAD(P)+)